MQKQHVFSLQTPCLSRGLTDNLTRLMIQRSKTASLKQHSPCP